MPQPPEMRRFDPAEVTASRVTKFFLSLLFFAAAESWRTLLRLVGRKPPANAVVIYYHHVPDEQRGMFSRQIEHLLRWTTPLAADCSEPLPSGSRYTMVTADDGWASFARNAVPELRRKNIPVTIFSISERLGESVDGVTTDRLVNEMELRDLCAKGVTVGSHTARHAIMTSLDEASAMLELSDSRTELGKLLGRDIDLFCFPYGAYSDDKVELCKRAGYRRAFTSMPHLADPRKFKVGRVRVDPTDWRLEFHLKLMGAYRWLPLVSALKQRILAPMRVRYGGAGQSPGVAAH